MSNRPLLCTVGLLLCPYFLWFSAGLLYTDTIACFFVLMGMIAYRHNRHFLSAIAFVLAIASRQFMLVFPAAIATYEFVNIFFGSTIPILAPLPALSGSTCSFHEANGLPPHPQRSSPKCRWVHWRWVSQVIAASSILGWIVLFQGLAPQPALNAGQMPPDWVNGAIASVGQIPILLTVENQETFGSVEWDSLGLTPGTINNFLSFVALYITIPEAVVFYHTHPLQRLPAFFKGQQTKLIAIAAGLLVFISIFPPSQSGLGILVKILNLLPSHGLGLALFYVLSLVACIRFSKLSLFSLFVLFNGILMTKAYPWDKYILPLVIVFWYLRSVESTSPRLANQSVQAGRRVLSLK